MNLNITTVPASKIIENLVWAGVSYVKGNPNLKSMVLGVSGGVDSAVTAYLARQVCDQTGLTLIGYSMPIITNTKGEKDRAKAIGKKYCTKFEEKTLTEGYMLLLHSLDPEVYMSIAYGEGLTVEEKIRAGNIKARVRMIHLYNMAAATKGMVLSTDNFTELLMGFWTLHGDVGDFGFIQNLWKTEVFKLAKHIGGPVAECGTAKPTDGLGVSDSDLDQLLPGWEGNYVDGYRMVDEIMIDQLKFEQSKKAKPYLGTVYNRLYDEDHPVVARYKATKFKRLNPINLSRDVALK
jgi:NAD+ synthetase